VLIVDDFADQLRALRRAVSPWSAAITARSPVDVERLVLVPSPIIQFAVVDYDLGGDLCGVDVIDVLRQAWPSMPAVIVSAHRRRSIERAAFRGRVPFLPKPCSSDALRREFDACFDERLVTISDMLAVRARATRRQRELIRYRAVGLTGRQLADRLGVASGTLGAMVHRLRQDKAVQLDALLERAARLATLPDA
jgi:DNA-binding NarL/FixJ family response regulator